MQTWTEPAKQLPVSAKTEILVAGSGPAGIGAALRAARMGHSVMLVEAQGQVGGIATVGMMSHFVGWSSSLILQELYEKSLHAYPEYGDAPREKEPHMIHHERLKTVLWDLLTQAGVKVLLYTFVCGVIKEHNQVCGVIIENKTGRSVILADRIIDATGDGDVAEKAGVPYTLGRETDGKMQPCTMMFSVGGVDSVHAVFPGSFESKVQTEAGELQQLAKEILPHPAGHLLLYRSTIPGVVICNMTNAIGIDGTKAEDLTRATQLCTAQLAPILAFLHRYVPGYANAYLLGSASLLGIRETRHFAGHASLSADDILTAKLYADWVVKQAYFNFDVHNLTGASLDKTGVQAHFSQNASYSIPYGCLLPEKVENLLLSGRNISGSHLAHSNFRVMPICMAIGEAAGAAAALSLTHDCPLAAVPVAEIQSAVSKL